MSEPLKDRHCGTCVFFRREYDDPTGGCHRYPPQAHLIRARNSFWFGSYRTWQTYWPDVEVDDFCGEYKRS
jgi:hypothetical protein